MSVTKAGAALCVVALVATVGTGVATAAPRADRSLDPAASPGAGCAGAGPTTCLLPFPDDRLTRADPSTPTGRRLALPVDEMPVNVAGKPIDPAKGGWNGADGFSPMMPIIASFGRVNLKLLPPYW